MRLPRWPHSYAGRSGCATTSPHLRRPATGRVGRRGRPKGSRGPASASFAKRVAARAETDALRERVVAIAAAALARRRPRLVRRSVRRLGRIEPRCWGHQGASHRRNARAKWKGKASHKVPVGQPDRAPPWGHGALAGTTPLDWGGEDRMEPLQLAVQLDEEFRTKCAGSRCDEPWYGAFRLAVAVKPRDYRVGRVARPDLRVISWQHPYARAFYEGTPGATLHARRRRGRRLRAGGRRHRATGEGHLARSSSRSRGSRALQWARGPRSCGRRRRSLCRRG